MLFIGSSVCVFGPSCRVVDLIWLHLLTTKINMLVNEYHMHLSFTANYPCFMRVMTLQSPIFLSVTLVQIWRNYAEINGVTPEKQDLSEFRIRSTVFSIFETNITELADGQILSVYSKEFLVVGSEY